MIRSRKWYKIKPIQRLLYLCIVKTSKLLPGLKAIYLPVCALLLVSCTQTSAPPAPVVSVNKPPVTPTVEPKAEVQAEAFKYEQVPTTPVATNEPISAADAEETHQLGLIEVARKELTNGDKRRALAISFTLQQSEYAQVRQQNQLLLAQSFTANQQWPEFEAWLQGLSLQAIPAADRLNFVIETTNYYSLQQDPLTAINWLFELDILAANIPENAKGRDLLWQQLVQLSDADIQALKTNHPRSQAWLELLRIAKGFAGDQASLKKAVTDWVVRNPMMPAEADLPADVQNLGSTVAYAPARVGVVLPLSGQFKTLGESLQLGMVAAASESERSLVFIDSTQTPDAIIAELEQANVEFVLGPLLREDVDKLQAHAGWRWPTLFLNSKPEAAANKADQFYFALGVEDEAAQMMQYFQQRQFHNPVLIYAVNPIGQRMAQHFQMLWQQRTGKAVESYSYGTQDQLKSLINQFLETSASEERVKELNRLSGRTVKAEMHSRQDIDAIYLIADPVQTRLFKPFIDVTVSPTARSLPIFTSSRSHSLKVDRSDQRDLAGLTMTEMPWLLPQATTSTPLRASYDQLFPEQDETLQRLFAMGFDAVQLIERLKIQQQFPIMSYQGLTGSLRLPDGVSIQRQLTLAQYRQGKLQLLEKSSNAR